VEERLSASFEIHDWPQDQAAQSALLDAQGSRIVGIATTNKGPVTEQLLDRLPALKIVSCSSAGYEGIDAAALKRRGIEFANTSRDLAPDVADMALALMLAMMRRVVVGDRFVRSGKWQSGRLPNADRVNSSRVGIIGLGQVGREIAKRATAFGMEVGYFGPTRKPDVPYNYFQSATEIAAWCSVLTLSCVGGVRTRHIVNAEVLRALGSDGWLVNVARGSVIDHRALIAALQQGSIKGAGLDVFEDEPNVPQELLANDRVVLTPHHATSTDEAKRRQGDALVEALRQRLL
jgi:lactate dehydrogenase-like 2-hydroxyacid dehydrogenase